jgi:hypothetical protein
MGDVLTNGSGVFELFVRIGGDSRRLFTSYTEVTAIMFGDAKFGVALEIHVNLNGF